MNPYYEHGGITIYHGDCRDVLRIIELREIGAVVTDPPYGMNYQSGWDSSSRVLNDKDTSVRDAALQLCPRPSLVFGRWNVPRPPLVLHVLYWDKGDWPGMGDLKLPWGPSVEEIYVIGRGFVGKRAGSILRDPRRPRPGGHHPTEKPVGVMRLLVERCPDGVILDPFMGSASTLVAAKELGREAVGIEIEEKYCKIAARRLAQEVLFPVKGACP